MDNLMTLVTLLVALSVASERLVEIIKGLSEWLSEEKTDNKRQERLRKAALQALAIVCGVFTAFLAKPAIESIVPELWQTWYGVLALGLLASGGSGFWNAVLAYLLKVKDIKKIEAERKSGVAVP